MMIYAVDDEQLGLRMLTRAIAEAAPDAAVRAFPCGRELLSSLEGGVVPDVTFLDIELPDIGGLELAYLIKKRAPRVNIVFVTGLSQYAQEAYALRPSGYVMKPASADKILAELENLRNPLPRAAAAERRVRVQCFGNFEVFAGAAPLSLARSRSKELLAFLVDRRGAAVTMAEISEVLWEDGQYSLSRNNQIHNYLSDLTRSLSAVGGGDILCRKRNSLAVNTDKFSCDYYDCLRGDPAGINAYNGEYMSQYSWAEFTTGELTMKYR